MRYKMFTHFSYLMTFVLAVAVTSIEVQAQDIHYSQAQNSQLNFNPALTGIFNADMRFSANYRHQWYTVPVDYVTFTGAFDKKFYSKNNDKSFWSGGAIFNYDKAGDSRLQFMQLGLSASYTYLLNENNLLTVGAQVSGANRSFTEDQLEWDNQWNGVIFDPQRISLEDFDRSTLFYLDLGAGINYRWQKSERTNINIGSGFYHFTTPDNDFYEEEDGFQLPLRYSPHLNASFRLVRSLDLLVNGLAQVQGEAKEVVSSAYLRFYLNQKPGKTFKVDVGAIGRWSEKWDAFAPAVGFWVNNWHAELSYDVNLSDFTDATNRYGGPEITLQYFITTVKPLNSFKTCPIF